MLQYASPVSFVSATDRINYSLHVYIAFFLFLCTTLDIFHRDLLTVFRCAHGNVISYCVI